jgi:pimeloyl-ACP methyl ester carboxylesterase
MLTRKCFKLQKFINPKVLSKEELQDISVPIYFMIGENDVNYSAKKAVGELKQIAPKIKTEIFNNAGHDLPILYPEIVNKKIIAFFQ